MFLRYVWCLVSTYTHCPCLTTSSADYFSSTSLALRRSRAHTSIDYFVCDIGCSIDLCLIGYIEMLQTCSLGQQFFLVSPLKDSGLQILTTCDSESYNEFEPVSLHLMLQQYFLVLWTNVSTEPLQLI